MNCIYDFLVEPLNERSSNIKSIDGKELILNTEMSNHSYVSRLAKVLATPRNNDTGITEGDTIIIHHNVFRIFLDIRGQEKNSRSYYSDGKYFVGIDQIFGYKKENKWIACKGFNFIKPIKETKMFSTDFEKPLVGILKYKDPFLEGVKEDDLVGFSPSSEYEFVIDNQKLYRVPSNSITIKYEYNGDEEEYNPRWS
jgi:hypothetical protein